MNIEDIERRLAALEAETMVLKAERDVANLMGRFAFLQSSGRFEEILDDLWSQRRDRSIEEGPFGVYADALYPMFGVRAYYNQRYGMPVEGVPVQEKRGRLVLNALTSPVIQIAPDGQSAAGTWITTGHESRVFFDGAPSGLPSIDEKAPDAKGRRFLAFWVWLKYRTEFVREDAGWKILHMHVHEIFRCPFDENWISYAERRFADDEALDSQMRLGDNPMRAEYPTTSHWQYGPEEIATHTPTPPKPL